MNSVSFLYIGELQPNYDSYACANHSNDFILAGLPVLIVSITLASASGSYSADEYCWLSVHSGVIWGFVGPVIFIITVQMDIFPSHLHSYSYSSSNYCCSLVFHLTVPHYGSI